MRVGWIAFVCVHAQSLGIRSAYMACFDRTSPTHLPVGASAAAGRVLPTLAGATALARTRPGRPSPAGRPRPAGASMSGGGAARLPATPGPGSPQQALATVGAAANVSAEQQCGTCVCPVPGSFYSQVRHGVHMQVGMLLCTRQLDINRPPLPRPAVAHGCSSTLLSQPAVWRPLGRLQGH